MRPFDKENKVSLGASLATIIATIIAIFALVFSYLTYRENIQMQNEVSAYTFWQSYIQLAANNPEFASGRHKDDDSTKNRYAWFVANALEAAEIVYHFQPNDRSWK